MNTEKQEQSKKEKSNLQIKKSTILAFLCLILFRVVLDLSYYFVISPVWGYARFTLDLNNLKLVESYLLFIIIFILMPKSAKKLSNIMVWLLILLAYIPMLTIFAFMNEARTYMYAVTGFWMIVFLFLHMPTVSLAPLKQSKIIRYSIFICLGIIVLLLIYKYLGLSFSFDFTKVYDIRREYVGTGIPLAGYLFSWMAKIVNPLFFALFIMKRKWLLVAVIVVLQVLLFSATGEKIYFLALPVILALMWIIKRKNPLAFMGMGLVAIVIIGMLSYWLIDDLHMSSLFARRTLLIPAQLSFFYYDFFSKNELVLLSSSRLGFFLDYPYHLNPPHLIAEVYFNLPQMGSNTGVVGDAYMNFGFIGLALYGMLLAIILKLVDTCSKGVDFRVGVAAIAMPAIGLTNGPLTTVFLTGGLFLALIILYLLPKKGLTGVYDEGNSILAM